jgi:hypothetical protein
MTGQGGGGGLVLTIHQSYDRGREIDYQHGHIINTGWDSLLLADYWCKTRFMTKYINLTLLFCDWGR